MIYHHYLMHFRRRFLHAYRRSWVMLNILLGNCSLNRCNPALLSGNRNSRNSDCLVLKKKNTGLQLEADALPITPLMKMARICL